MKRHWHWSLWAGLALALAGVFSFPLLANFSVTRNYGWANFVLLISGVMLLLAGTTRAFREPTLYRGKVLGSVFSALSLAVTALFAFGILYMARIPAPASPLTVGQAMGDFSLTDQDGKTVTPSDLLTTTAPAGVAAKGALLIFY